MSFVTIFYGISFYVATLILFIGVAYRIYEYSTIPAPLKIPTPPAPKTKPLVAIRILEKLCFLRVYSQQLNGHGYLAGYFILHFY
jgi:nitrate reductase gamma subunit